MKCLLIIREWGVFLLVLFVIEILLLVIGFVIIGGIGDFLRIVLVIEVVLVRLLLLLRGLKFWLRLLVWIKGGILLLVWGWILVVGGGVEGFVWLF